MDSFRHQFPTPKRKEFFYLQTETTSSISPPHHTRRTHSKAPLCQSRPSLLSKTPRRRCQDWRWPYRHAKTAWRPLSSCSRNTRVSTTSHTSAKMFGTLDLAAVLPSEPIRRGRPRGLVDRGRNETASF